DLESFAVSQSCQGRGTFLAQAKRFRDCTMERCNAGQSILSLRPQTEVLLRRHPALRISALVGSSQNRIKGRGCCVQILILEMNLSPENRQCIDKSGYA